MAQDKRWRIVFTALMLVALATLACRPLGGEETLAPTPTLTPPPGRPFGDGVCDEAEKANPGLCPQDCTVPAGESTQPAEAPPTAATAVGSALAGTPVGPRPGERPCGDGVCDGPENAQNCPQDCASPAAASAPTAPTAPAAPRAPTASTALPLYVTVYYHVEPNSQLFDAVEPGYFEAVSLSLREMSSSLASINVPATFCFAWLYNDLVAHFDSEANVQIYYPSIAGGHLEDGTSTSQGVTFMPVQAGPQAAWMSEGVPDDDYYDSKLQGGTGGGGIRWTDDTFHASYTAQVPDPWTGAPATIAFPSLAEQFNNAMQRHLTETPLSVNAWGFDHHVVDVLRADLGGLGDNWKRALLFMGDIADGAADGVIAEPRPDLVQFVTMQELSGLYDSVVRSAAR